MPSKIKKTCNKIGCPNLTTERFCNTCKETELKKEQKEYDQQRGTSAQRGYGSKWSKQSKHEKGRPENQFCYIRGPRCTHLVETMDHITPVSKDDPLFKDPNNHGPACQWCNFVYKKDRTIHQLYQEEKEYYDRIQHNPIEELKRIGKVL
jgi:5-methylcytosine-specific restriction protein A